MSGTEGYFSVIVYYLENHTGHLEKVDNPKNNYNIC